MFEPIDEKVYRRKLIQLKDEDKEKLRTYLAFIRQFNAGAKEEILAPYLNALTPLSPSEIYKFSENSTTFKKFCQQKNSPFVSKWMSYLKEKNYLGMPLLSLDEKLSYSVFDQYCAAYLYSHYLELCKEKDHKNALAALTLACNLGLFQALTERCQINKQLVKTITEPAGEKAWVIALGQFLDDVKTLGNLYGTIGHLHGSLALLDLGNFLLKTSEREGAAALGNKFHTEAVEHFFQAKSLTEHDLPDNLKIILEISKNEGLALYKFRDWPAAEIFLWENADKEMIPGDTLREKAKENIKSLVKAKKPQLSLSGKQ
jgi:hypothetical protein